MDKVVENYFNILKDYEDTSKVELANLLKNKNISKVYLLYIKYM